METKPEHLESIGFAPHEHKWKVDYSQPTKDSYPVHRTVVCDCGAVACREDKTGMIHNLRQTET